MCGSDLGYGRYGGLGYLRGGYGLGYGLGYGGWGCRPCGPCGPYSYGGAIGIGYGYGGYGYGGYYGGY